MSLAERRRCVTYLKTEYEISERHACQAMDLHGSSYRHAGTRDRFDDVYRAVMRLSAQYPYFGYRKIYDLLRPTDIRVSRERVRLIRRREGLQVIKSQGNVAC